MTTAAPAIQAHTVTARDATRPGRSALAAFLLPVFFIVMFAATLVTAFHAPRPHDLALTVAGPSSSTARLATALERKDPSAFDITRTTSAEAARTAVLRRDAVGAVVLGGTATAPTVTAYTASAGGRSAATVVSGVADGIAAQERTTARVVDLAPLNAQDTLGLGIFYVFLYSGFGGYITLMVLLRVLPAASLRAKYLTALGAAIGAPVLVFGLASIFVAGFGASFGQIVAVLGVDALYVLTIALGVIAADQLLGAASVIAIMPFVIFLNLPSSGGGTPESLLPGFWQAMHSFWLGAGDAEALRDILYFPGADPIRWIIQVLVWTIGLLVVTLFIHGVRLIWRLQTLVLTAHHQGASVREHMNLMGVPRQPAHAHRAIDAPAGFSSTAPTTAPSPATAPAEGAPSAAGRPGAEGNEHGDAPLGQEYAASVAAS